MSSLSKYIIQFGGLNHGVHQFEYQIDETFFSLFEGSEQQAGMINVLVTLNRQENMIVLNFKMDGYLEQVCDLCLENFRMQIDSVRDVILKMSDHFEEEDEDVYIIPRQEHQVNIAQHIYDYINLSIPIKKVHPEDSNGKSTCNPEALKRLNNYLINDKEVHHESDPRWDILKTLNTNREN